jgi:hypothetical protein
MAMLPSISSILPSLRRLPASTHLARRLSHHLAADSSSSSSEQTFPLSPGGLLHICCTQPGTSVDITNGAEDAVSLQVKRAAATCLTVKDTHHHLQQLLSQCGW